MNQLRFLFTGSESVNYKRDIEESDETLEENVDTVSFWEKKQRELVTSVVDYSLQGLSDLVHDGTLNLSPSYQRRFRWDPKRQSKLVESFLMNVPVPPVFLNEDDYGEFSVIDGKQRINAIHEFMRGRLRLRGLEVFSEINDHTFDDLPAPLQRVLRTRPTMRAVIILRQSDDDVKYNVFQRLNTGGVRLNAQEIRNSAFPGPLNDLIVELSETPEFHRLLGISAKRRSAIFQEMRDAEFVLRFFTFRDTWDSFSGGMKRNMDRFMSENRRMSQGDLDEARHAFLHAISTVSAAFNGHAFQRWVPEKQAWRRQVLAALYDAQMFSCKDHDPLRLDRNQEAIVERFKGLFSDPEFRKSIDAATNTPRLFRHRIRVLRELLDDVLG